MTVPSGSAAITASSIESVDAFARQLYRRARTAGHDFTDIATVVRGLHTVLKHLRVEAEDPDSLLNSNPNGDNQNSLYARQLMPIVEDCDFTLKQLDTILEKYGGGSSGDSADEEHAGRNGRRSKEVESREKDMIALIRTKLANQKTNIDIFLDTVQLHNPVKARRPLPNPDGHQLDAIKDKVDAIATRLFQRRGTSGSEDDEELWQQFRTELEKEGFSSDVLRSNKEVLRAYIRELDSHDLLEDGAPQSVRGLLGNSSSVQEPPPMTITPASYTDPEALSPKESFHRFDNEKFSPDVKNARPVPTQGPPPLDPRIPQSLQPYHRSQSQPPAQPQPHHPPPVYNQQPSNLSYEQHRSSDSSDTDSHSSQELALISTRDLMTMDYRQAELMAARMGAMHLGPPRNLPPNYSYTPESSFGGRYLPPTAERLSIMPPDHQLTNSGASQQQQLGTSPRYLPPYPTDYSQALSPTSSTMTPPPAYGSSPTTAGMPKPGFPSLAPASGPATTAQRYSRLAPDSQGRDIPLDAKWTRIKRSLVSPVVLDKAGVRYEARPEFVAVLGVIARDKIEDWARQSAEVRNARRQDHKDEKRAYPRERETSRDDRRSDRKPYPVGSPSTGGRNETYNDRDRRRRKGDLSSDSDSGVLWDESDTTEDERHDEKGRYRRDRYMPRNHSRDGDKDEKKDRDGGDSKGSTFIPIIVPPMGEKASPSSTVGPKPILKNRNTNHVRFDADGPKEFSSEDMSRSPRPRDHDRHRHRDDRDRDRDRSSRRDRDRDRDHHHHRHHGRDRERERERDRDRDKDRDRDHRRDDKASKKSALRETLGAVGIGGAAASLLSVLTEAASGL